jgi:hypothetical protein
VVTVFATTTDVVAFTDCLVAAKFERDAGEYFSEFLLALFALRIEVVRVTRI